MSEAVQLRLFLQRILCLLYTSHNAAHIAHAQAVHHHAARGHVRQLLHVILMELQYLSLIHI